MRTIKITISPESQFIRPFLISVVLLVALVWRLLEKGDHLFSTPVGLSCGFVALACLSVCGAQYVNGRRWSWPAVFFAVCGTAIALVWLAVAITRAIRFA
jgi:hypothetical protein